MRVGCIAGRATMGKLPPDGPEWWRDYLDFPGPVKTGLPPRSQSVPGLDKGHWPLNDLRAVAFRAPGRCFNIFIFLRNRGGIVSKMLASGRASTDGRSTMLTA